MAFSENLTAFFSDFAVSATFTPAAGPDETANVILDTPTETLMDGRVQYTEYMIYYPATALPNIKGGDYGVIDGVQYRVREIRLIDDGKIKSAVLTVV